jgi:hypothetical protein
MIQVEACCVQELKRTKEAWCIDWKEDTELKNRRRKEQKCISERRTESATDVGRETLMQAEKSSVAEQ